MCFADLASELDKQLDLLFREFREPEDPPEHVFHYTTADGLIGITQSHALRASHSRFLNDASEPAHAQSVLKHSIDMVKQTCSTGSLIEQLLASFWNWALFALDSLSVTAPKALGTPIPSSQAPELYVFCLSEEPDLLSQWRAYSEQGSGYAVGFSSKGLKNLLEPSEGQYLVKVVYDQDAQLKQAQRELGRVIKLICDFEKRVAPTDDDHREWIAKRLFQCLLYEVIRLQAKFKSAAYHEEKEWRILQFVHPASRRIQIEFRSTRGRIVPYLELDFR